MNFDGSPTDPWGSGHDVFRFDAWQNGMDVAVDYAWFAADEWGDSPPTGKWRYYDGKA
jgi:hypothetical protein